METRDAPTSRHLHVADQFGRLVVLRVLGPRIRDFAWVRCLCGREKQVRIGDLKYGRTKSCGCLRRAARTPAELGHRIQADDGRDGQRAGVRCLRCGATDPFELTTESCTGGNRAWSYCRRCGIRLTERETLQPAGDDLCGPCRDEAEPGPAP